MDAIHRAVHQRAALEWELVKLLGACRSRGVTSPAPTDRKCGPHTGSSGLGVGERKRLNDVGRTRAIPARV